MITPSSHSTGSGASPTSNQVSEILARASITEVWRALGGDPLRHGRGRAFWRDGDGFNISLSDDKGAWYDFVSGEGGGVLDLISLVRNCSRANAARWLAGFAGIPLPDRPLSQAQKRAYARARAADDRDLPEARSFGRTLKAVAEQALELLPVATFERMTITQLLARVSTDAGALAEYRAWGPRRKFVRAMVAAGRESEAQAQRELARVLMGE